VGGLAGDGAWAWSLPKALNPASGAEHDDVSCGPDKSVASA